MNIKKLGRSLATILLGLLVAGLSLFPRVDLAYQHFRHQNDLEYLINTQPANMAEINAEFQTHLDRTWHGKITPAAELYALEAWVNAKIEYKAPWNNYGNIVHWTTAKAVWERRADNCVGRAIFTAALLRYRGHEAHLQASPNHMWVSTETADKKTVRIQDPQPEAVTNFDSARPINRLPIAAEVKFIVDNNVTATLPYWRLALTAALVLLVTSWREKKLPVVGSDILWTTIALTALYNWQITAVLMITAALAEWQAKQKLRQAAQTTPRQ